MDGGLMASDGQYSTKKEVILCDPKIRGGMTFCFFDEKCKTCPFAIKYDEEHPEEVKA
jgi:hypothetical protein